MAVARPTSDVSIGSWTDQSSATFNLFSAIGESGLNLSTYVQVVSAPLAGDPDLPATFGLSATPTLGAGERFRIWLYASAAYVSGTARPLHVELLDGSILKDFTTISVSNAVTVARFGYTVDPSVTTLSSPRIRLTLLHDGTDWQAIVYQAWVGSVFPHLAPGPGGAPQLQAAESGADLVMGTGGVLATATGTEDETALIMGPGGVLKAHG